MKNNQRVLEFLADKQILQKAPGCDFSNIVPGTRGYLAAHFTFSDEWADCVKAASFWADGFEHAVLLSDDACTIPDAALVSSKFEVSVSGARPDGFYITTARTTVKQEG